MINFATRDTPAGVARILPKPDDKQVRVLDGAADQGRRVPRCGAVEREYDPLLFFPELRR